MPYVKKTSSLSIIRGRDTHAPRALQWQILGVMGGDIGMYAPRYRTMRENHARGFIKPWAWFYATMRMVLLDHAHGFLTTSHISTQNIQCFHAEHPMIAHRTPHISALEFPFYETSVPTLKRGKMDVRTGGIGFLTLRGHGVETVRIGHYGDGKQD